MSTKKNKIWVKSAFSSFSQESTPSPKDEPPVKKFRSNSQSLSSSSNSFPRASKSKTETLTKETTSKLLPLPKLSELSIKSFDWIENFSPKCVDDLAVHNKKIAEVQDWLTHCEVTKKKYPGQISLITGPAGSGKTATLKIIAESKKYEIVEWINPIDLEFTSSIGDQDDSRPAYNESHVDIFKRFLFRSSRYKSIFDTVENRLILVEDFPNAFIRNSEGFTEILQDYKKYGKSPLVFIVADSKSRQLNISYNLFPDLVKEQLAINHISFNAISSTLMKKALKRIQAQMSEEGFRKIYKSPTQDIVDSIALAAQGDIRNAVINLHFGSLLGAPGLHTQIMRNSSSSSKATKSTAKFQKKLTSMGKDESITMMHALGRVFNPKYIENCKPRLLHHSPEELADNFSSQPKNFVDFVHANYLSHFSCVENVLEALDCISIGDLVMGEYREDCLGTVGLNIALRGAMVSNETPVTGWKPIRGPKRISFQKDFQGELIKLGLRRDTSGTLLASDFRTHVRIIRSAASFTFPSGSQPSTSSRAN